MARLAQVMRIRGVWVYIHWSVFVISIIILLGAIQRPAVSLVALVSYLSIILIHEYGHLVAAQRLGCRVSRIELYPIWGITYFETPWSRFDHCLIAWAGVLAQSIVAFPLLVWVLVFGYTRFEAVNAFLALLGGISLLVAVFNLLPIPPLDGAVAWSILPEFIRRLRLKRTSKHLGERTYRR